MTQFEQNFLESATKYFRENTNKEIDWEQRRYEIAKSIMTTAMTNSNFSINNPKYFAGLVVSYTDALIEELKK